MHLATPTSIRSSKLIIDKCTAIVHFNSGIGMLLFCENIQKQLKY